jgi:ATP-dependent RNA helicase SUPV3L1/SUV3
MKRHFILHVGPTNTGKTYDALMELKRAESGIYLAPLRLLAMEVQERMLEDGIFCSLLTGEEEDILKSATVLSATVEKLDINHPYEVAVIDECQMITDPQRGASWTRAILGVRAERIHICMAPEAEHIVRALISDCKDTYEIVRHKRKIPLQYENKPYQFPEDIRKGDALVVFSRKQVLSVAAELRRRDIHASVIYGALPYAARKRQVHRFLTGESQVLVTTDAIGMGMNLPIRRIVFMDIVKFNGKERRMLEPAETKQIAGRAGRQGMYEKGYVACIEKTDVIRDNLETETEEITQARLNFSEALLESDYPLDELIRMWSFAQVPEKYSKMDTEEPLKLLGELRSSGVDISGKDANRLLYQMITVGFDTENRDLVDQWLAACLDYLDGAETLDFPDCDGEELLEMEMTCKELDLYYQMCHRFHMPCEEDRVAMEKDRLAAAIDGAITRELVNYRKRCRICGTVLPWDAAFGICSDCFAEQKNFHQKSVLRGNKNRYTGRKRT